MSDEKRMPAFRLKFRSKDKVTYDVGTVWSGRFPDSFDVKPETRRTDGKYPARPLSEALAAVERKEGWLSLVPVKSKGRQQQRRDDPPEDFGGGGFDDDVPFAERGEWF